MWWINSEYAIFANFHWLKLYKGKRQSRHRLRNSYSKKRVALEESRPTFCCRLSDAAWRSDWLTLLYLHLNGSPRLTNEFDIIEQSIAAQAKRFVRADRLDESFNFKRLVLGKGREAGEKNNRFLWHACTNGAPCSSQHHVSQPFRSSSFSCRRVIYFFADLNLWEQTKRARPWNSEVAT